MGEIRNLLQSRTTGDAASEVFRTAEEQSKSLGEITGGSVVVRTAVAAEPGRRRVDAAQLHPLFSSLCGVVLQIDRMADFMGDVVSHQRQIVLRPGIDFKSTLYGERHRPKAGARVHEHDFVPQLLPSDRYQVQCRLWTKWFGEDVRGRKQTENDYEERPNATHSPGRINRG